MIALVDQTFEDVPRIEGQDSGQGRRRLQIDERVGDDGELPMVLGQIEVMDLIAEVILISEDARARIDLQPARRDDRTASGIGPREAGARRAAA